MTIEEYHKVLSCKVDGTWNLHNVALENNLQLDFFTMLSSISSVLGTRGQGNYVAGNSFLDAFAAYRQGLGLPGYTVNLGIVEDVGYMAREEDLLQRFEGNSITTFISELVLSKIMEFAILQQSSEPVSSGSRTQMITGLSVPQARDSELNVDARFSAILVEKGSVNLGVDIVAKDNSKEIRELNLLLKSKTDAGVVLDAAVNVVSNYLAKSLRLEGPVEPERPLSAYGIDSLAAVEFRNWLRRELNVVVATLDLTTAPSLIALCQIVISKVRDSQ